MLEDLLKGVPVTVGELHGLGWNASGAELEADEARLRRVLAVYEGQFLAGRAEQAGVRVHPRRLRPGGTAASEEDRTTSSSRR